MSNLKIQPEHENLFQIFTSLLNVEGRRFGQQSQPHFFGISDGNKGVQWNLSVNVETKEIRLGVNLEGSKKTGRWLIVPFILNKPNIDKIRSRIDIPNDFTIRFSRDAWQGASRLNICEKFIGGHKYLLSEIDQGKWLSILDEALSCLDESKDYRGRKTNQLVTLSSDGRKLMKDISPHLTIYTHLNINGNLEENIKVRFSELKPIYDWVVEACRHDNIM